MRLREVGGLHIEIRGNQQLSSKYSFLSITGSDSQTPHLNTYALGPNRAWRQRVVVLIVGTKPAVLPTRYKEYHDMRGH